MPMVCEKRVEAHVFVCIIYAERTQGRSSTGVLSSLCVSVGRNGRIVVVFLDRGGIICASCNIENTKRPVAGRILDWRAGRVFAHPSLPPKLRPHW